MELPDAFSPEVQAELSRPFQPFDPRNAEIGEGVVRWYVVSVFSRDAELELAKRRFGIYVPATEVTIVSRGRKVDRHHQLVPGYVFVLLWETDANWIRLATTPSVDRILGWVEDIEIDKLRQQEKSEQLDAEAKSAAVARVIRSARKRPGMSRRKLKLRRKSKRRGVTSVAP